MKKTVMLAFSQSVTLGKLHPYFYHGMVKPNYQALSEQFELVVEDDFCNLSQIVNKVQPDLIMIDPGPAVKRSILPDPIKLKEAAKQRPIIIYSMLDAHYHSHHAIAKYLELVEPEAIFSHDYYHDYYPQKWRNRQFFIPNSYNHDLFRKIDLTKDIMCGFYGAGFFGASSYPWRQRIAARVLPEFPSYVLPRPTGLRDHGIIGEPFVEVMNRTKFIFGCTSLKDIPVKKIFEVPACGSMLVCNPSIALEKLGFQHGVNCCFVDTNNVLQTLRFYLENEDEYQKVVNAGQELVENHHQAHHRKHILNWWQAFQKSTNNQVVLQSSVTGEFLSTENKSLPLYGIATNSEISKRLKLARLAWKNSDYVQSSEHYIHILSIYPLMPEAVIGVVGSNLMLGFPDKATAPAVKFLTILDKPDKTVDFSQQFILYAGIAFMRNGEKQQTQKLWKEHGLQSLVPVIDSSEKLLEMCIDNIQVNDFLFNGTGIDLKKRRDHFRRLLGIQENSVSTFSVKDQDS